MKTSSFAGSFGGLRPAKVPALWRTARALAFAWPLDPPHQPVALVLQHHALTLQVQALELAQPAEVLLGLLVFCHGQDHGHGRDHGHDHGHHDQCHQQEQELEVLELQELEVLEVLWELQELLLGQRLGKPTSQNGGHTRL